MIYFLQCGSDGPIKIGCTEGSVVSRVRQIQMASPHILEILGAHHGDRHVEAKLHQRFAEHQVRGEWFHPVAAIFYHIEAHGGLEEYHRLERPDLKRAIGRSVRKLWPQDLKERYKGLNRRKIGRWQEGLWHLDHDDAETIQAIVSDPRIKHLAGAAQ